MKRLLDSINQRLAADFPIKILSYVFDFPLLYEKVLDFLYSFVLLVRPFSFPSFNNFMLLLNHFFDFMFSKY